MLANLDANGRRWRQAGPGHFNDADMLEVCDGLLILLPLLLLLLPGLLREGSSVCMQSRKLV